MEVESTLLKETSHVKDGSTLPVVLANIRKGILAELVCTDTSAWKMTKAETSHNFYSSFK
jgi:hypothetical protein